MYHAFYSLFVVVQAHHPPEFYKHIFYNAPPDAVVCAETESDASSADADSAMQLSQTLEAAPQPAVLGTSAPMVLQQPVPIVLEPPMGLHQPAPVVLETPMPSLGLQQTVPVVVETTPVPSMVHGQPVLEPPSMPPVVLQELLGATSKPSVVVQEPSLETTPKPSVVLQEPSLGTTPKPSVVVQEPAAETTPKPSVVLQEAAVAAGPVPTADNGQAVAVPGSSSEATASKPAATSDESSLYFMFNECTFISLLHQPKDMVVGVVGLCRSYDFHSTSWGAVRFACAPISPSHKGP